MSGLREHMSNCYSQCGEDGVLTEMIRRLDLKDLWCCEFGAWDGKFASNTFNLVEKSSARAVMIEGNRERYQDLLHTKSQWPRIHAINAYVSHDRLDQNHLDRMLAGTDIPRDFDVLSIDIDGDDLLTWQSIQAYRPKIVIIEINPRIEPGIHQWHHEVAYDPAHMLDLNSFTSTVEVAKEKGYDLVCHTSCNLIFVRSDFTPILGIEQSYIDNPDTLFDWKWVKKARKAERKRQREQTQQT